MCMLLYSFNTRNGVPVDTTSSNQSNQGIHLLLRKNVFHHSLHLFNKGRKTRIRQTKFNKHTEITIRMSAGGISTGQRKWSPLNHMFSH
eukprot:m.139647 g.139647  ORF g.139647 m.139647 type:complete len:89 (+) comp38280_c2_seq1:1631-1897(+)